MDNSSFLWKYRIYDCFAIAKFTPQTIWLFYLRSLMLITRILRIFSINVSPSVVLFLNFFVQFLLKLVSTSKPETRSEPKHVCCTDQLLAFRLNITSMNTLLQLYIPKNVSHQILLNSDVWCDTTRQSKGVQHIY